MTQTKSQKARKLIAKASLKSKPNKTKPKKAKNKKGNILKQMLPSVGGALGGLMGMSGLGTAVGTGLSRLFGSGDYKISNNSFMEGGVPSFSSLEGPVRFRHKELVAIPSTSTNFGVSVEMPLNPGVMTPILSQLAQSFTMYKFHGLVFIYNPSSANAVSSTNTALGVVGMVANYDPTAPSFTTRQAAEEYAGAQASVPSDKLLLPVECKNNSTAFEKRFVRTGANSGKTLVETDLGTFQFFSDGAQAASVAGEIWVAYDVEFYLPKVTYGGIAYQPDTFAWSGVDSTNMARALQAVYARNVVIDEVNGRFLVNAPGTYIISVIGEVDTAAAGTYNVGVFGECQLQPILPKSSGGVTYFDVPENTLAAEVRGITFAVSVPSNAQMDPAGFTLTSTFGAVGNGSTNLIAYRVSTSVLTEVPVGPVGAMNEHSLVQQVLIKNNMLESRLNLLEALLKGLETVPRPKAPRQNVLDEIGDLDRHLDPPPLLRQDASPPRDVSHELIQ